MDTSILLIIAGMAIVTYIPRMLPLVFWDAKKIPPKMQAILRNVPYAALGALIFPGILTVHENVMFGIIGGITAAIIAYFGASLIVVVLSSIGILSIISFFL
ncbi:AzlD domain-containing protein [Alkalihalobacterium alkalinitrilicum]|uniref:AzlD domain-containing protein n=1 Tax=Alkalihalobacterium alkalinitrilicum TaxID=427920 RepID=UPI000995AE4D|nr:AzlD domain-containing protein [Alkalihalobacterium alkalinitrilicum]